MLFSLSGNMGVYKKKIEPGEYEIIQEGQVDVMKINCIGTSYPPSIEDSNLCMLNVINKIIGVPSVDRIILSAEKNYQYSSEHISILREIANLYVYIVKQKKVLSFATSGLTLEYVQAYSSRFSDLQYVVTNLIKSDPIGAYVELKRLIREQKLRLSKIRFKELARDETIYLGILTDIFDLLNGTKLISAVRTYVDGHEIGDRALYKSVFRPLISPNFMFTRLMSDVPLDGIEVDAYSLDKESNVVIFETPKDIKLLYHLNPPEFNLSNDKSELLDLARSVLAEHKPRTEEFVDPDKMRQTFYNVGRDLLLDLVEHKGYDLDYNEVEDLANILVRYTVGFGLIEILLMDSKIQDIVINGPIGETPIYIVHQDHGECVTNIIPSREDGESWATKFRMISGRPLDEANPVLDTQLFVPGGQARVAIISKPLNPLGYGYAFRRHREHPWTLPLFINNKMINSLGAALLSFAIDGGRTMLIAGTRSSGKTSLLGSCLVEIMRKYRIITIEDTLELPIRSMRELGYNIQPLKVRAALSEGGSEMSAEEGIRTSLRLGDSSLIIGEVRSKEALALYEAMRVGALANVVAGTIHGGSPYSVFDRVVNDLGVPRTSFKATDLIIVANPIKSPDGLHKIKRVLSITEVRKDWEEDPLREGAFVDLMKYNVESDQLEPTDNLINGDSEVIKGIASTVREWVGDWDAVWSNIELRAKIKQRLVDYSNKIGRPSLLEAEFVIDSNDQFHKISDRVLRKVGKLDSDKIYFQWNEWLKKETKIEG
ncbi:type II/IV secretion system ATPase subunit [archaeon]|nr:type II/IV secretion system ATPase subunit [archaeon]MBT6824125.1 type II/IV secretion system ATPase subunit [archaeon]MBT7107030.1 type II/IV secretion system ATPase subunit [archaeon]MBT7297642.1 type II/IV secretion system ATPase subunit [archaeon]